MFFSELESYLSAGLDFNTAFSMLIESQQDRWLRQLINNLYEAVIRGETLADAMVASNQFAPLDYGVVRIGEQTGKLTDSLIFLTNYYHGIIARKRIIIGALSYPLVIIFAAIIVMVFMLTVIVPMFEQVYSRMGGEMPAITQMVISISENFKWVSLLLFICFIFITVVLKVNGKSEKVKCIKDNFVLKIPLVGVIIKKNIEVRFCVLLHLLYSSGIPLLTAVGMLRDIITLQPYQKSFDAMIGGLERGDTIKSIMMQYNKLYSRKLTVLIGVGEETNRLSRMLKKEAEDIGKELEYSLKQLGNMLEPILIMSVGAIVAFILIAMYMPMFNMGIIIK